MKKKMVYTIIVVILMIMSAVLAVALLTIEEDDDKERIENVEASGNGITIGDVDQSPSKPSAGDHVTYYVKIDGLPLEHTILLVCESYNQSNTLRSTYRSTMTRISSITFKDTDILNDDVSGFTVKYRIFVYDQEIDDLDDLEYLEPVLESDLHTYVIK